MLSLFHIGVLEVFLTQQEKSVCTFSSFSMSWNFLFFKNTFMAGMMLSLT